jgi:hypothetical protein
MFQYGAGRAQARLLGVPTLLPLIAPAVLAIGFVWPMMILGAFGVYGLIIFSVASTHAVREEDLRMLYMVPVVFVSQHVAYVCGFWAYVLHMKR